jgi:hypothetical protein
MWQWQDQLGELSGENVFLQENSAAASRKRGRPTRLDEPSLINRRDSLVQFLEGSWGSVGRELQTAETLDDVRRALGPIAEWRHELSPLIRSSATAGTSIHIRAQRKEILAAAASVQEAYELDQKRRDEEQRAEAALHQVRGRLHELKEDPSATEAQIKSLTGQIGSLELEHARRKGEAGKASAAYAAAYRRQSIARDRSLDYEAYFAQQELLRFVQSGRCALKPINFANAMAGLPFIGWRQSSKRCTRHKCRVANSAAYQQFRIIQGVLSQARDTKRPVIEHLRAYVQQPRKQHDLAVIELRKYWYYVSEAILKIQSESIDLEYLEYRILSEYSRRIQSRSALDLLREEEERLA